MRRKKSRSIGDLPLSGDEKRLDESIEGSHRPLESFQFSPELRGFDLGSAQLLDVVASDAGDLKGIQFLTKTRNIVRGAVYVEHPRTRGKEDQGDDNTSGRKKKAEPPRHTSQKILRRRHLFLFFFVGALLSLR
jgi:hypothetical protein